jgi:hypothetical protein
VPESIRADYQEAAEVLSFSPKASAALSRRCLQAALSKLGFDGRDLSAQIDKAMKETPSYLAGQLDSVRNVGNFAAHPQKALNTGEILDVEPEEAAWNLDVLDLVFDFGFVQPEIVKRKTAELNEKLKAAGKPEMKQP